MSAGERFCEGCPFANGVTKVGELEVNDFSFLSSNPRFKISFTDKDNSDLETSRIEVVPPHSGFDPAWPQRASREALRHVDACNNPIEVQKKRLGGLLGSSTVKGCGAFPNHTPTKVWIADRGEGFSYGDDPS